MKKNKWLCGHGESNFDYLLKKKPQQKYLYSDLASLTHAQCISEKHISSKDTSVNFQALLANFLQLEKMTIGSPDFIEKYLLFINNKIITICKSYSAYELFFWYRRLKPTRIYNSSLATAYLYSELVKYSSLQYGHKEDIFAISENREIIPPYLLDFKPFNNAPPPNSAIAVLVAVYKIESLCFYYVYLRNCYRTVCALPSFYVLDDEYGIRVSLQNHSDKRFLDVYDKRHETPSLLDALGTVSFDHSKNDQMSIIALQRNFNNENFISELDINTLNESYNFSVHRLNLQSYYDYLKKLNSTIFTKTGFYVEDFLSVLIAFSDNIASSLGKAFSQESLVDEDVSRGIIFLQRGYFISNNSDSTMRIFIERVQNVYKCKFPDASNSTVKRIRTVIDYLFYKSWNFPNIENEVLNQGILFRVSTTKYIIDYTGIIATLRYFPTLLRGLDGDEGNICARDFEEKVNNEIISIFGENSIFRKGEVSNNKREKKEIDASFIYKDCMFILECKSLDVSDDSILAVGNAIKFRKNKIDEYVNEVESKARFIYCNCETLSCEIPNGITYIIPLVITSWPELLCEEKYYITDNFLRVLVLQEIKYLKDDDILDALRKKDYVLQLNK